MIQNTQDWRFFILIYIIGAGIWGTMVKYASSYLGTFTTAFISVTSASIVVAAVSCWFLRWQSWKGIIAAAVGGLIAGVSTLAFYAALRRAPASIVIPLSSLSIVVTVLLSFLFLKESLNIRQSVGITLGLLSIILLSW